MPDELEQPLPSRVVIDRREAIRRVSAMLGGAAFIGGTSLMAACSRDGGTRSDSAVASAPTPPNQTMFTAEEVAYLDEIAETILPATSTPGAKAAGCGLFMAVMVQDCYEKKDQDIFRAGLTTLNDASQQASTTTFVASTPEQRTTLLTAIDKEAKEYQDKKGEGDPNHYFRMMKELTLLGFFTSEVGMTKVLRYAETPGRFDPCVPYVKGEALWANHA